MDDATYDANDISTVFDNDNEVSISLLEQTPSQNESKSTETFSTWSDTDRLFISELSASLPDARVGPQRNV